MARTPFLERLEQGPILSDGAMGTMLHQAGVEPGICFDSLNLSDPALVAEIHRKYIEAGAEIIETNTFGANEFKLRKFGMHDQAEAINKAGVELARRVVDASFREDVYVAGSVGPLGAWIEPVGRIRESKAFDAFRRQIAALIDGGADAIVLETFNDVAELVLAIRAARDVQADFPVIAQLTFTRDDRTVLGDTPAEVAGQLAAANADVIGINCSGGPAQLLRLTGVMRRIVPGLKLSVQPNAGWPEQQVGGRVSYPASPHYFSEYALAFSEAGLTIIGGCCGTTPEHTHAMRTAIDDTGRSPSPQVQFPSPEDVVIETPIEQPTQLSQRLAAGDFVTTVEIAPPKSFTAQRVIAAAEMLKEAGVDFVNVSDAPLARMRMSPWAVAFLIAERVGLETILHFPVRGRNLLRLQGDLLAAHAMNIRNIFVTMGDPNKIGDYPESFDNYDVVSTGLLNLIEQRFNAGVDQAGKSIGQPTVFTAGAALNMNPHDLERELKLARRKKDNGAKFFLTQPIFDPGVVQRFLDRYADFHDEALDVPIIAGLLPLFTPRHARFLHNEVPGIVIPEELRQRMDDAQNPEAEGVLIAQELLLELRQIVQGSYLMPPFGRYYLAAEVIEALEPQTT